MGHRIAAALSLIVFTVCLLQGMQAGNTFATVVGRALLALVVTLVIGLILGAMAQRMVDENLRPDEEKLKKISANSEQDGR